MVSNPSSRWKGIPKESAFLRRLEIVKARRKKAGKKVIELVEGDPVLFGHKNQSLSSHLLQAVEEGWHMYPAKTNWRNQLREAISGFEKKYRGVYHKPQDIVLAPGVAGCFQVLHSAILDVGDEMLSIEPSHYLTGPTSYLNYFLSNVVTCPSEEARCWEPNLEKLRSKITEHTKGIVIVNPNNPTGTIYSSQTLIEITNIAGEYDIPIIADEIYGLIAFDGTKSESMAAIAKDVPTIILNGMSKFFMRTGWRVGYMCFHDPGNKISRVADTVKKVANLYGHTTSSMPTPILVAATKAFQNPGSAGSELVKRLQNNRDFTCSRLREIDGISCVKPRGAMYAFPHVDAIGETWKNDELFLLALLDETGIIFRPGSMFGRSGEGHFRTLLLPKLEVLEEVYDELERFMEMH